jgi:hypothetical protein
MPIGRYDGRNAKLKKKILQPTSSKISNSFRGQLFTLVNLHVIKAYTLLSMPLKAQLTLCVLESYMGDWKFRSSPSILKKTVESVSHAGHFSL